MGKGISKYNTPEWIGQKFGRLTVLEIYHVEKTEKHSAGWEWKCKCDCGNETTARPTMIFSGKKLSCGCLKAEQNTENLCHKTHGQSHTRLNRIWCGMKYRCKNERCHAYAKYGGRGITICDEWDKDFSVFYDWSMENGYDDTLTIERIDVNKGYNPDNCKWVTLEDQAANKQNTVWVDYHGERVQLSVICRELNVKYNMAYYRIFDMGMTADEALDAPSGELMTLKKKCELMGIDYTAVKARIKNGWDEERALTTPVRSHKRKEVS